MRKSIESQLSSKLDPKLVKELLDAHEEVLHNFYMGGLRLSAVEGGRFCEAAFRLLEQISTGSWTPLNKPIDTEKLIDKFRSLDSTKYQDSIRLHIPRALRLIYDVRNKRDTAHLADGIDPNLQDATLVVANANWVLAEFLRLYHDVSADEAHKIVDTIVSRRAPIVQDFDGFKKVLNPKLTASDHCLVLLYARGKNGATYNELDQWVRPSMKANLKRTLYRLVHDVDLVHFDGTNYIITRLGENNVEERKLY